jgi:hypothetical protein
MVISGLAALCGLPRPAVAAVANLIETLAGQVWPPGTYFSGWKNG